jgi:hypothetical protein
MKRARLNTRKLLVASAGVATINYVLAAGCGGNTKDNDNGGPVANLVAPPGQIYPGTGGSFNPGPVANLVAPPPPQGGTGGSFNPGPVANLMAPPPPVRDAAVPDAAPDATAADAALDAG